MLTGGGGAGRPKAVALVFFFEVFRALPAVFVVSGRCGAAKERCLPRSGATETNDVGLAGAGSCSTRLHLE